MPAYHRQPERPRPTMLQRINPVWWLGDSTRLPGWSWWSWFKRNPASNFLSVIVGVAHRPRTFVSPDTDTIWSPSGKARCSRTLCDGLVLPLYSFKTASHEAAWGWKPDGSLSFTWRRINATEAKL